MNLNNCPVRKASALIETPWTALIIKELLSGKKSNVELESAIDDADPRTLSLRLRTLIKEGFITRKIHQTFPITSDYELTDKGKQFELVINAMTKFGQSL